MRFSGCSARQNPTSCAARFLLAPACATQSKSALTHISTRTCDKLTHVYGLSKLPEYEPATAAFQRLSYSYETLSKPASRRLYDLGGSRPFDHGKANFTRPFDYQLANADSLLQLQHGMVLDSETRRSTECFAQCSLRWAASSCLRCTHCSTASLAHVVQFLAGDFETIRIFVSELHESR